MTQVIVCKVGGALIDKPEIARQLIKTLGELQAFAHLVLVHGGGKGVEHLLSALDLPSEKYQGLRITPPEHIPYVTGALAGTANKNLCALAFAENIPCIGLSLFDGHMIRCNHTDLKLGCVGTPQANDPRLLNTLLDAGYLPIISSIGCDHKGRLLNVNADQAATALAIMLKAELYLLSDVDGVWGEDKSVISRLSAVDVDSLIQQRTINDGMQVKVEAAQIAANALKQPVTIGSWAQVERLKIAISSNDTRAFGTKILPAMQAES